MTDDFIYDLLGIGIGPFNLGLAALLENIKNFCCLFIDQSPGFDWHPGMMVPGARMQVPFLADLVTLADPKNPYNFLNYLHVKKKHFRYVNAENSFPLRQEFNDYYQWVAKQLSFLRFNRRCEQVNYNPYRDCYEVKVADLKKHKTKTIFAKKLVIGIGTEPHLPPFVPAHNYIIHSANYLYRKKELLQQKDITLVGSGQSAAEVFLDLLNEYPHRLKRLTWFSKSYLTPMDTSKFTIEMTTPAYIDYFYALTNESKEQVLKGQHHFYKGISNHTLNAIAEKLYLIYSTYPKAKEHIRIHPHCTLTGIEINTDEDLCITLFHRECRHSFEHRTNTLILATGYKNREPYFLKNVKELRMNDGRYDPAANYAIDSSNTIFLQNADLHSHGFNSADLELGPKRNAVIINSILGYEHYTIEDGRGFQTFG